MKCFRGTAAVHGEEKMDPSSSWLLEPSSLISGHPASALDPLI
jgi:hypothetical protein